MTTIIQLINNDSFAFLCLSFVYIAIFTHTVVYPNNFSFTQFDLNLRNNNDVYIDRFVNIEKKQNEKIQLEIYENFSVQSFYCYCIYQEKHYKMELQEKFAFAQKNLVYDTIPLIIIDKMERKHFKDNREIPKYYYVSSPFWMKFRLLLFWILWFVLIMAMMLCILTYFCFTPRMCYSSNIHRNTNG